MKVFVIEKSACFPGQDRQRNYMLILEVSKCSFLVPINIKIFSVYTWSILEEGLKIFSVWVIKA